MQTNQQGNHFLVVGAFRDNETPPEHPMMQTVASLKVCTCHFFKIRIDTFYINELVLYAQHTFLALA